MKNSYVPKISILKLLQSTSLESWERKFLKTVVYRFPTKAEGIVIEAIDAKVNSVSSGLETG